MSAYEIIKRELKSAPKRWLVTGVAGFIGSNLLEALLRADQEVVGLDNFSTGKASNLTEALSFASVTQRLRFSFVQGDIRNPDTCKQVCSGAHFILHHAALGSVPRSLEDPIGSHDSNVSGFINMLVAARDAKVERFVYASSSSVYGDNPDMPKVENVTGRPLSPYAATKGMNELYAGVFSRAYGFDSIGLRYFNVFGPRQDPAGAYAAVIPRWVSAILNHEPVYINGDGETSRDFCYIQNVVQANFLAATTRNSIALNRVYNIAVGERTTLKQLFDLIRIGLTQKASGKIGLKVIHQEFRPGDVRHSLADVGQAREHLDYAPEYRVQEGINLALDWYVKNVSSKDSEATDSSCSAAEARVPFDESQGIGKPSSGQVAQVSAPERFVKE